ncbi:DUF1476 domain-containing protein [Microvirga alba]|uniref:DUF1476 domain-containing protein n=1 Tax=Microvirga alba TaxID=2791025 RepID=A0A931FR50_9HYPH|nr:DUF1476 domain-containing protein [Microvirga alba]MBF9232401.1 DUF1476 domain-containing protein [Microvirga alba]
MTIFENRERGFEQMFAHEEETRFRALARRDRLIGLWAAAQLGLTGEQASAYADGMRQSAVSSHADEAIVQKIRTDFEANGIARSDDQIREKMAELLGTALAQVRSEAP